MTAAYFLSQGGVATPPVEWWCDLSSARTVTAFLAPTMDLRATPLLSRPDIARDLGLRALFLKDETARMGLGSFKALGGAYAVIRLVHRLTEKALGRSVTPGELLTPVLRKAARDLTVVCASDGNHGLSVAAGARLVGAKCVVFLHTGVANERAAAIERLNGIVHRTKGAYEESVAAAAAAAKANGCLLVSDTAGPGDENFEACQFVMQGYSVLADEVLAQLEAARAEATHVFVQAGVGGLAASIFGHWFVRAGAASRPQFVVVEPERAACLSASAQAGRLVQVEAGNPTAMAMLECQRPSPGAWPTVSALARAFITIPDEQALAAVDLLARAPVGADCVHVGPSGAAGLAGLMSVCEDKNARDALRLDATSTVLALLTEGVAGAMACAPRGMS